MKPKLVLGVTCDYALISADNKLSVMGIFHEINSRKFPVIHPAFFVVLQWFGGSGRYEEKVSIIGPTGKELANHVGEIALKSVNQGHVSIIRYSPFRFEEPGNYHVRVSADGDHVRDIPFSVQEIKEQ